MKTAFTCPTCRIEIPCGVEDFPIICCGNRWESLGEIPRQHPKLLRKLKNLTRDTIAHTLGRGLVDDATREMRRQQCLSCVLHFDPSQETCTHPNCGCGMKKQRGVLDALGWASKRCPIGRWHRPRFVTNADLARDTLALAAILPHDLAGIVGIPRSGMIPAALLATHLHLPLYSLHEGGLIPTGHGWRMADSGQAFRGDGPIVVVDDTSMYGGAMKKAHAQWEQFGGGLRAIFATVYCATNTPHNRGPMPDLWAVDLPHPHFLEWCLFNCGFINRMALDFDGILTVDQTHKPQYLPRKHPVPMIITGRFEHERARTEAWLAQHGVKTNQLVMFPGTEEERARPQAISQYKAREFVKSDLEFFVESDQVQASEIAGMTGRIVICPTIAKVF